MFSQRVDTSGSMEVRKFLIKWQGLSYSEATWETEADVLSTGDQGRVSGLALREWSWGTIGWVTRLALREWTWSCLMGEERTHRIR